ncbi:phosphogluconate dehydratase [Burkholderia thailandensis]|uniref:Phosphogluconate dehydratase n=1 Tax=Burkholderia thailandensis (strain ATCC 700388 / DSM 13276 / CCUG 48851 / CIP 106301 / E264) TaxID=271848 RepID=Q2SZ85_BURTA|nr:phosphogluconate dehydratase [Burkholderia thailandensis]ABC38117.1 phosphogluconate dehydratase [Burkholderia thailandensis E264]AHI74295.1 phosphogluconate dehydratase [Burkholderia thailandensis 2002721723]AIP24117.1 phosphogluconate dehydratase [Burkholderia thailandensis E264]AJX98307.1 phosphogluconate dehydratase [Burkholderia thailandensis 2002721643]MCS6468452.1 phosphogluconate dehydratase [Burkholderia thailandensis]
MATLHPTLASVTERVIARSRPTRQAYLARIDAAQGHFPARGALSCANLAHGFAGLEGHDKFAIKAIREPNIGIVSAYNEMLSAHAPYKSFPDIIKAAARERGGVAQFAGGVPAMCDGVTQGNAGMELSLFSREVISMSTAVALTHNMFDAALCLGICDKIVPGLLIGALQFGHLPTIFVPAGPMTSGLSNDDKAKIRQQFATGQVGRDALLEAESAAYHGHGTCTFYGTANSNQMLMEVMGLHLPSAAFVHPHTPLRDALTAEAARRVLELTAERGEYTPIGHVIDERAIVNGIVALLATGGSTNHTLHLVAIARAAGILIDWDDFDALSAAVPLLAKIYPNGKADVNHFHAAGGIAFLVRNLLEGGLLHEDVTTVAGKGLAHYTKEPRLIDGELKWVDGVAVSADDKVLRPIAAPFQPDGGLRLMQGRLGRGVIKISAVAPEHRQVKAPAIVFDSQEAVQAAFDAGELKRDFVAVVRFQGARANGMPELHRLTPLLGVLQDQGFRVALVTDGRMSGASGKVPAVIHVSPEALLCGPLGKVRTGDTIVIDAQAGVLDVEIDDEAWAARAVAQPAHQAENEVGFGRELFGVFRAAAAPAEQGASVFGALVGETAHVTA